MSTEITTLGNGLRIVSERIGHLETVSLGVWVAAGARHEQAHEHGLAHFLEHMAFKGTSQRTARRIAEEIEEVGGELNAATGLDSTAYYARVLKGDEGVALELLADILLNSSFHGPELEREREVILQEIAATIDSPEDVAFDLVQQLAYPGQALGRPILGTAESVGAFQAADLRSYLANHYRPDRMIVSAAGAIDHDALVRHVEALFGGLTRGSEREEAPAKYVGGVGATKKPFEQSHVVIGLPSPSYRDKGFYAAQVFSGLFGGGMSSRLFQEVREQRGLCYSIYSTIWGLRDTGMLTVHAATAPDAVEALARVVSNELDQIAHAGPNQSELERSKAQLKAGLLMALESSSIKAEQMARQLMSYGRLMDMRELVDLVSAVSQQNVRDLAGAMATAPASVVVVGSGRKSPAQAESVAQMFAREAVQAVARH